jgi:tyrosinase
MDKVSRRSFVGSVGAIPFYLWAQKHGPPPHTRVRHEVHTPQGKAMLKIYADAVDKMMKTAEGDPIGWTFQFYTHFVKGSTSKAAEIARIYGANPSANKALAQAAWSTCQAHAGGNEDFFLPWHRMFVLYLEHIVREVSKHKPFMLPYWNYSTPVPAIHGVMPQDFRLPASVPTNPLYRVNRNPGPNQGHPIDATDPGALDLTALKQSTYSPQGAAPGFCQDLDFGIHGNVHVLIGNGQGMGSVPFAAYDAIFWMHHCNIDRLWASWNKNGGKNPVAPGFLNQQFTFADEKGQTVTGTIKDFLDISALDYTYDRFEPAPPGFVPAGPTLLPVTPQAIASAPGGAMALGAGPVRVNLEPAPTTQGIAGAVGGLSGEKKLYLVLRGLRAEAQPGVLYHVYLDLPEGTSPEQGRPHYVGAINFFDATAHGDHEGAVEATGTPKFYGLDVTDVAKALQTKGLLSARPALTIAPSGIPAEEAKAVVGEISLVAQ